MHSLLLNTGKNPNQSLPVHRAGENVLPLLQANSSVTLICKPLKSSGFNGWYVQPDNPDFHLIQQQENDLISILFFGYLPGKTLDKACTTAANIYLNQGIEAVGWLDGIFSCIIFDKRSQHYYIQSDAIGHRKLRVASVDGDTLFSSHDAALVATGLLSATVDYTRIEWAAKIGWSIGGSSFIKGLKTAPPLGYLQLSEGRLKFITGKIPQATTAFSSSDNSAQICEQLVAYTKAFGSGADEVASDLTCGVDSRGVLATIRGSGILSKKIILSTVGSKYSTDVLVGQQIAKQYGLQHSIIPTPFRATDTAEVWKRAKFKAFLSNGDCNFKRSLTSIPNALPRTWLTGEGGGIFKGFYFTNPPRTLQPEQLLPLLIKRTRSQDNDLLEQQLHNILQVVPDPHAALTTFFATDYIGVMGALVSRFSWFPHKGSPFLSTEAFRLSLFTRPEVLKAKSIHQRLLGQHLRATSSIPINGLPSLFTFNYKLRKYFARFFQKGIINHELEKRSMLIDMLEGELGGFLAEEKHRPIWRPISNPRELLNDAKAFNAMDKRIMACAFKELLVDLNPKT